MKGSDRKFIRYLLATPFLLLMIFAFRNCDGFQAYNSETSRSFSMTPSVNDLCTPDVGAIDRIGGGVTTLVIDRELTCSADKTAPATLRFSFVGSGRITIASGKTFTINGPIAAPLRQVFAGSGAVKLGVGSVSSVHPLWFNNDLVKTFFSAPPASTIEISAGNYSVNGLLRIDKSLTVRGSGQAVIKFPLLANDQGIRIMASNVQISGLTVLGASHAEFAFAGEQRYTRMGIAAIGPSDTNRLTNVVVKDCAVSNWTVGLWFDHVDFAVISSNNVKDLYSHGITVLSSSDIQILGNVVDNIPRNGQRGDAYGIALTKSSGSVTKKAVVEGNTVSRVPTWHCINSHGGEDLVIKNNTVRDCRTGIHLTGYGEVAGAESMVLRATVTGNVVSNNHGAGQILSLDDSEYGIMFNGQSSSGRYYPVRQVVVADNKVTGFSRGIVPVDTLDSTIRRNLIYGANMGIYGVGKHENLTVDRNVINEFGPSRIAIAFVSLKPGCTGVVSNNDLKGANTEFHFDPPNVAVGFKFFNNHK